MVTLRALEPEDLELLYTIENDASLWWIGTQTAPYSRYQLRDYIASSQADIYKDGQVRFVIEEDGTAVGLADLFDFSPRNMRAEIGIALLRSAQGHGVARQAVRLLEDYGRNVVPLSQIYAIVPESNTASVRMLTECGFQHTATLSNWVLHAEKMENAMVMQFFYTKT